MELFTPPVVIGRTYAKMKVVTDKEKENFGRPFFVCPHERHPCNFFAWGDQEIPENESSSRVLNKKETVASFSNGSKSWKTNYEM